jgi:hypothetical protein
MDFPGENVPAWSGFWVLNGGVAVDLTELRVFSGNQGRDGRVFQHYDVFVTADPSPSAASDWTLLIAEVTSAPFWTSNAGGEIGATLTRVTNPAGGALAADITGLQLAFYAVSRTDRVFHDDWDACSGDDRDATDAAFESPLIYEVDAYFGSQPDSTSLHVDSIVLSTANAGKKKKKGRAQATIQDNLGSPVPSAVVTGTFSGDFNETLTATTNSSGVATFTTTRALRAGLSFQFCVDNVSYGMLPYEPQNNLETCDIY